MLPSVQRDAEAPVADTPSGRMIGTWAQSTPPIAAFRGIPYAQAPVGPLRFAAPVPREPWAGILDATQFGPTPQRGDTGITLIPETSVPGDDTLNVNVWTPTLDPAAQLPVVVWIHGGGFTSGSPASTWYDGSAFARDGVVLVTLSYRIGFTGFGWIDGAVPNRGVLDWICALEWVQLNIASFGGDPQRVTIAGQSAGGGAVLTLLGAPAARGLFSGGYALSAAIADPSVDAARDRSHRLAKLARVTPDLHGFSELTEARILELQPKIASPSAPRLLRDLHGMLRDGLLIGPVADGSIVPGPVEHGVAHGPSAAVPLVLGTADDELLGMFKPGTVFDHMPRRAAVRALGASAAAADRWLASDQAQATDSSAVLLGRYVTDAVFRSWVPRIAAARTTGQAGPTWSYRFAWHADEPPRAGHCIDVPFVFDQLAAPGVHRVAGEHPPQELADAVHGALVRFAQHGDPGWEPDRGGLGPSRVFDLPVRDETDAYAGARALL
ncbi:para-nitrobenzyl esterase [Leucobacter exalbidus]|uniref:Carboxylic ester hydrolase n=1 Tax=Leucobacter exalbidus TaxID=662960 RepID=A0A940PUV0_9MICO|nr:carboxylesterase family protein [Leucobacter exalbidus]MBP1326645.1 para-nitrobenzyl esterase [Leucobacter exalbidus]